MVGHTLCQSIRANHPICHIFHITRGLPREFVPKLSTKPIRKSFHEKFIQVPPPGIVKGDEYIYSGWSLRLLPSAVHERKLLDTSPLFYPAALSVAPRAEPIHPNPSQIANSGRLDPAPEHSPPRRRKPSSPSSPPPTKPNPTSPNPASRPRVSPHAAETPHPIPKNSPTQIFPLARMYGLC